MKMWAYESRDLGPAKDLLEKFSQASCGGEVETNLFEVGGSVKYLRNT